jgi:hypothetical protein
MTTRLLPGIHRRGLIRDRVSSAAPGAASAAARAPRTIRRRQSTGAFAAATTHWGTWFGTAVDADSRMNRLESP